MKFKLIVAMVDDSKTDQVVHTAREAGVTGCTIITSARGQGLKPSKTFFGLMVEGQRDVVLLLVEGHLAREVLERISRAARFEEDPGVGIAFQVDIEDAIGLDQQIKTIKTEIEDVL